MDENQKREYKKLKERERRSKMSMEQKEKEKKNAKLGMQKSRSELPDQWLEYENITDKQRKRAERLYRDDVKHSKDNLKAKDAMKLMRTKLSDEYIPRGRQNKSEEDDWKKFYDRNEDNKELLEELQPETVKKILERKIKSKEQFIKKTVKQEDEEPQNCICVHEFDNCKFCQNHISDCSETDDDVYQLPNLTEEEIQEFNKQDFKNWKEMRRQERNAKSMEHKKLLRRKLLEPIIMPKLKKCKYEQIRDDIIAQRKKEWAELEKQWDKDND